MKLCERIELVAKDFPIGTPITIEELKRFKLSKDICKLVERGILRKLDVGVYTLDENYEENSRRRKTYQKFEDKMTNLLKQYKVNDIISNKDLRALGFDSHMVARLVHDGYLTNENYGEYKLIISSYVPEDKSQDKSEPFFSKVVEDKINNLYEGVLSGRHLDTQELLGYGFTPNYLTKLVNCNVLRRLDMGIYEFIAGDLIYQYVIHSKDIDNNYARLIEFLRISSIEFKYWIIRVLKAIITLKSGKNINVLEHEDSLESAIKANDFSYVKNWLDAYPHSGSKFLRLVIDDYLYLESLQKNSKKVYILDKICSSLSNDNLIEAFNCIHEYLEQLNLLSFEFLIIDLIELSLIEPDLEFARFSRVFDLLVSGNYVPDYNLYISYFYQAVQKESLKEAELYFDIIKGFAEMGIFNINIDDLKLLMNNIPKAR